MLVRLRERVQSALKGAASWRTRDEGVSPVVGMILVLAISIIGISTILYWGLPAIDEMKANVEFRSIQSQFEELDATVKELVAGTTEKTAKRWQPTLNRGQMHVKNNTEAWLFSVELYDATTNYDFNWGSLSDGDSRFMFYSNNTTADVIVQAAIVTGTSSATEVNVTAPYGNAFPQQMNATTLGDEHWTEFRVSQSGADRRLENATFRFDVYVGDTLKARAWYMSTGRVEFSLDAGLGNKAVVANNGAVFTGVNGAYTMVNTPPIPPPSNTSGIHRTFARMIGMGGDASFGGTDTFDMLISLYATATLASYDCAQSDRSDCIEEITYHNYGEYRGPWYSALQNRARGYDYEEQPAISGANTVAYLEDRKEFQGFTLLQSSLKLVQS